MRSPDWATGPKEDPLYSSRDLLSRAHRAAGPENRTLISHSASAGGSPAVERWTSSHRGSAQGERSSVAQATRPYSWLWLARAALVTLANLPEPSSAPTPRPFRLVASGPGPRPGSRRVVDKGDYPVGSEGRGFMAPPPRSDPRGEGMMPDASTTHVAVAASLAPRPTFSATGLRTMAK
jgi:hypothetical protein